MGRLAQRAGAVLGFAAAVVVCAEQHQCPADSAGSCEVVVAPPVIDVSALMSSDHHSTADWDTAAEAVARACEEWGFFQVWPARHH